MFILSLRDDPKTHSGTTPLTTNLIWEVLLALG